MDVRVADIEVKLAYLEKRMHDLDAVVCELGDTVTALRKELKEARETPPEDPQRSLNQRYKDDVPPHH